MPSASITSGPSRSRLEVKPTSYSSFFSHRADMYAVTATEFTAEVTADILINRYIPPWRCPRSILSDNGLQLFSKHAVSSFLGFGKLLPAPTTRTVLVGWSV